MTWKLLFLIPLLPLALVGVGFLLYLLFLLVSSVVVFPTAFLIAELPGDTRLSRWARSFVDDITD